MRIVGARFADDRAARAALDQLERLDPPPASVDLHSLGSTAYEEPATGVVVAGRFEDSTAAGAIAVLIREGGSIVMDRPELETELAEAPFGPPARLTVRGGAARRSRSDAAVEAGAETSRAPRRRRPDRRSSRDGRPGRTLRT